VKLNVGDSVDLSAVLKQHEWGKGVRIVVTGAMLAPLVNGKPTLNAAWRADVFQPGDRKPLITLIEDTPAGLFRGLADMCEHGSLTINPA